MSGEEVTTTSTSEHPAHLVNGGSHPIVGAMKGPSGENVIISDMTRWLTRAEVADLMGVTPQAVLKWVRAGSLQEHVDAEGTRRYVPEEVHSFKRARNKRLREQGRGGDDEDEEEEQKVSYASHGHTDLSRLLAMITVPREKVDNILVGTIERQERRIRELEAQNDRLREDIRNLNSAAELDESAQRIVEKESMVKLEAFGRLVNNAERLLQGGTHFLDAISDEKLAALAEQPQGYWSDREAAAIKEAHERRAKARAEKKKENEVKK